MKNPFTNILAKHEDNGEISLIQHITDVEQIIKTIAKQLNLDEKIARKGAILHDIGKVSPLFQKSLRRGYIRKPGFVYRHEIASLFFLSLLNREEWPMVIEMIVAHHKSVFKDVGELGLLDLDEEVDSFSLHIKGFDKWMFTAMEILQYFDIKTHPISTEEAKENYEYAISYCEKLPLGYSEWKGMLMAADHMASAMEEKGKIVSPKFQRPDLSFYSRKSNLYPLSLISFKKNKKHTIVTAPTGAGKTDFLLRCCSGRVFYTLPYQASINAMYDRIRRDLAGTNAIVTILHSASHLRVENNSIEESIMQRQIGASVKIMTPHQMASIAFGIKGYESMIIDLKDSDVILDEIHTYASEIQAIVLKIIEILVDIGCRIHIGTATMPTILYNKIVSILGEKDNVHEVKLSEENLESFNRHVIHKIDSVHSSFSILDDAIGKNYKILIVCNQIKRAQELYEIICKRFYNVEKMLIHSRYKRSDRTELERKLQSHFNKVTSACIVVATQVVEVSLDINFDLMVTESAPIDAMLQRFGRINRKRSIETIGKYKDIYVVKYSASEEDAKPYNVEVLERSFHILPDNDIIHESSLQKMVDFVYSDEKFVNIDYSGVIYSNNRWQITKLRHNSKSTLLDLIDINSAVCITESDKEKYLGACREDAAKFEIPVSFRSIGYRSLQQIARKNNPYIIPDRAYDKELGLVINFCKPEFYNHYEIL